MSVPAPVQGRRFGGPATQYGRAILWVDEDTELVGLVTPILERRALGVYSVTSLKAAREALDQVTFDAVIIDELLPGGEAPRWIQQLRRQRPSLTVVLLTAPREDAPALGRLLRELQVSLVLCKPLQPPVVAAQIERLLGRSPQTPSADVTLTGIRTQGHDYALSLPDKIAAIRRGFAEGRVQEAELAVVRLARSASSFGFPVVGEAASRLQRTLARLADAPQGARRLQQLEAESALELLEAAAAPRDGAAAAQARRLLIVEPAQGALAELAALGRQHLLDVVAARTVAEALTLARRAPPQAALISLCQQDGEDGVAAAHALRSIPGLEQLPFAFLTEGSQLESRVAAAHFGARLCLVKPLDEPSFTQALQSLFDPHAERPPRVVIVDDDEDFLALAALVLRDAGMDVAALSDPGELLGELERQRPDVVLVDAFMPRLSGFDLCRILRTTPGWQEVPVLFLTADAGARARASAFEAGADDYLLKPIVPEELRARVLGRAERTRLLRERSGRDDLTGLWTRGTFNEMLAGRLAEAIRYGRPLSISMIDLNGLKQINDAHGHLVGDQVLRGLGRLLHSRFRPEDLRGRWGGDEYVLAFPGQVTPTAHGIVRHALEKFRQVGFPLPSGNVLHGSFSAGVASYPEDGQTAAELYAVADRRLYRAKSHPEHVVSSG